MNFKLQTKLFKKIIVFYVSTSIIINYENLYHWRQRIFRQTVK